MGRGGRAPSAADTVVCALRVVACHVYKVYHLSNHYAPHGLTSFSREMHTRAQSPERSRDGYIIDG